MTSVLPSDCSSHAEPPTQLRELFEEAGVIAIAVHLWAEHVLTARAGIFSLMYFLEHSLRVPSHQQLLLLRAAIASRLGILGETHFQYASYSAPGAEKRTNILVLHQRCAKLDRLAAFS